MSEIERTDISEIIEMASMRLAEDQDRLTEAQVDEIAAELGIPREYVDDAQAALQAQRRAEAAEEVKERKFRKELTWVAIGAVILCGLAAVFGYNGLSDAQALVERQHAQLINVTERQVATKARLAEQPHSNSKAAELAGAENRVRIERTRYDEYATSYNQRSSSFPTGLWRALFGFPTSAPLSSEKVFSLSRGAQ